jgi:hypothetical protein
VVNGLLDRHQPDDVVAVDVVRPDDRLVTESRPDMRNQVGEGVRSEASSEVKPDAVDLEPDVAPCRPAQRATLVVCHRGPLAQVDSSRWAKAQRPPIMCRNCAMVSISTPITASSRSSGVYRAMISTVSRPWPASASSLTRKNSSAL